MGKELDSLCDIVSFGAAPALLVYVQFFAPHMSLVAMLAALFFVVCGAYRLARFNIDVYKRQAIYSLYYHKVAIVISP